MLISIITDSLCENTDERFSKVVNDISASTPFKLDGVEFMNN